MSIVYILILLISACHPSAKIDEPIDNSIRPGAHNTEDYFHLLEGKRLGLVVNHSSLIGNVHLVDSLLSSGFDIAKIFSPEHGFTGLADAGEKVEDDRDKEIPIISLYGKKKKPGKDDLKDIDLLIFDIQDVGARFFTYLYTLHYVLESAAENDIPVIILDRPNPNGFYIDGPILDRESHSFVGMHPIPVVYGMTIGEWGKMVNTEGWLDKGVKCDLTVTKCSNYDHTMTYDLPVKPSPNLPNLRSILLYPSLCFFEGTVLSVGRGTDSQFQLIGHPDLKGLYQDSFTPESKVGASNPKLIGEICYGLDFTNISQEDFVKKGSLDLRYLIEMNQHFQELKLPFFNNNSHFDRLAGKELKQQIQNGWTEKEIRASWQDGLSKFKLIRKKYLLYP